MTVESPGFHARDNWHFRREPDGSVRILAPDSLGPGAHQTVTLDPGTWASVVAAVSKLGEMASTFAAAESFHAGRPLAVPASMLATAGPPQGAGASTPTCPTCCTHDHT